MSELVKKLVEAAVSRLMAQRYIEMILSNPGLISEELLARLETSGIILGDGG
ncbi:MAG: hypothetical protein HGA22_04790, partial [Clostridiales bacterium]|nr:hypothetical protein [Clostridiales bacterium]